MNHPYPKSRNAVAMLQAARPALKVFALFLICTFMIRFSAGAQGQSPACSIAGPLETSISGSDLVIHVKLAHSSASPELHYSFFNNSSHSTIRNTGTLVFDAATNSATQDVTVAPGNVNSSGFSLKLKVVTAHGTAECTTSVSVSR